MKRMRVVDDGIACGLEGGWGYRPDWRVRLVKRMHAQHLEFCDVMFTEKDPFVRQFFRLKTKSECAGEEAFHWAEKCQATRRSSIASGVLKAMTIAGCPVEQITERLHAPKFAVSAYQKLFFDVARYRSNRAWLKTIALPEDPTVIPNPVLAKGRMLMAAAFHGGAERLNQVMIGSVPKDSDVTRLRQEIRAILTEKAHEFLQSGGTPSAADLERYLEFL